VEDLEELLHGNLRGFKKAVRRRDLALERLKAEMSRCDEQWIVTIDGEPVAGTNGYSRRDAIESFMADGGGVETGRTWREYLAAGYAVVKVRLLARS